jgi:hypothetical protein
MPFQIKFAAFTLDGLTDWSEEVSSRTSPERFPRRQGAVVEPVPFLSERTIRVTGIVDKSNESALVTYLKNVGVKLHNGVAPLYLRDDQTYINAVKTNYGYSFKAGEAAHLRAKYFIDFCCGDPYWYSETVNTSTQTNRHIHIDQHDARPGGQLRRHDHGEQYFNDRRGNSQSRQ